MILASANLGRGVGTAEFRMNARRILDAGGDRAAFAFQEIDEADHADELDYLHDCLRKTHTLVGGRTAVPWFIPNHFAVLDHRLTLGCQGLAKFTPARPINEVTIGIGPNLTPGLLNFHVPLDRPETRTRRVQMRRKVRLRASRHDTGLWTADTNHRAGWPTLVRGEVDVWDAGIDKAKAWSEDRRVVVSRRRVVPLTIDGHSGHVARVRWEVR